DTVWRKLEEFPEGGLAPVARMTFADLRGITSLADVIRRDHIEHVVVVSSHTVDLTLASELLTCGGVDAWLSVVPPLTELFLHPGRLSELGGVPFIPLGRVLRLRPSSPGKRAFDLVAAGLALLFFAPVLLVAMLAVLVDDGRPVFYRQRRVGRHGQTFGMLKLRSMVVGADRMVETLREQNVSDGLLFRVADDPRVTRSGRILRR